MKHYFIRNANGNSILNTEIKNSKYEQIGFEKNNLKYFEGDIVCFFDKNNDLWKIGVVAFNKNKKNFSLIISEKEIVLDYENNFDNYPVRNVIKTVNPFILEKENLKDFCEKIILKTKQDLSFLNMDLQASIEKLYQSLNFFEQMTDFSFSLKVLEFMKLGQKRNKQRKTLINGNIIIEGQIISYKKPSLFDCEKDFLGIVVFDPKKEELFIKNGDKEEIISEVQINSILGEIVFSEKEKRFFIEKNKEKLYITDFLNEISQAECKREVARNILEYIKE